LASRPENLADIALRLFGEANRIDLEPPTPQTGREPPSFE
jgi:hypothetical protein